MVMKKIGQKEIPMLHISETSIVYMLCPADKKTGGTELAHQLVSEMVKNGVRAYITYYYWEKCENPINTAFWEYVNDYKKPEEIIDSANNVLIVPEINYDFINRYDSIQKAIWWMSVDNYVKNDGFFGAWKVNGLVKAVKALVKRNVTLKKRGFDHSVAHFYQSEYAHDFLEKNGIYDSERLSDFINDSYLQVMDSENKARENVVLYNPKKGIRFTRKLINRAKGIRWKPIENMTTEEVGECLRKNKVYIDFGNHPGKDRFPREAAISGCCVITGKKGSAAFYQDIPIPDEFKFDSISANIPSILKKIEECMNDYEEQSKKYEEYREMIRSEHEIFKDDIKKIITEG